MKLIQRPGLPKPSRTRATIAALLALLQPMLPAAAYARREMRPAGHSAHPALWQLQGRTGSIYLFGTIHALPPHFEWENPVVKAAIEHSDRLVLEAVIDKDQANAAAALLKMGVATKPLPPIVERVGPKLRDSLKAMAAKTALPIATLDKMKTWAVGMILFGVTVSNLGVTSADGVEEQLKTQFRAAGKPVEGLETLEQQLGFFDTLDEAKQRDFLESVVDQQPDDAADFGKMLGAWSHGDEKGISTNFAKDMKGNDALRTVLLARRNMHWADALVARLAMPGTQFVAVGAGHLTGTDSVLVMLGKLGYVPTRVQ